MPVSRESREQLGRALAEAREEAGLTVVELAQRANPGRAGGLSRYYDAEAGRRMATSETVSHYARALGRQDLHDLRNKILSKRPAVGTPESRTGVTPAREASGTSPGDRVAEGVGDGALAHDHVAEGAGASRPEPTLGSGRSVDVGAGGDLTDALPRPELLPAALLEPTRRLTAELPPLVDGTVVRGREAIVGAACALLEEAIDICAEDRSVAVQIIQLNPDRTFTRNLGAERDHASQFFPYQIQRLVEAGGSVRHLLASEIMQTLDVWAAFERFIALMELAGDYSVYWPSRHQSKVRMVDYVIIEGVAALEIFPTDPLTTSGDAAVIHRDSSEVLAVIKEYGENLIAEADEVFQITDPSSTYAVEQARVWVEQSILEAEQNDVPRFLFKYGFSTMTEPLKSYEQRLLEQHRLEPDDRASWPMWVRQDLEIRRRRLANFLRQIGKHRAIDVVPLSALRYYVEHGRYSKDCSEFADYSVPVERRIQHLRDVITLISTNQLYDLVVIDDDPPLTHLIGSGIIMMGRAEVADSPWMIFYHSEKPGPGGEPISVAFETKLDLFRERVGGRIALLEPATGKDATQRTLRLLHDLLDELEAQARDR